MKIFKNMGLLALMGSMVFAVSCDKNDDTVEPTPETKKGEFAIELEHLFDGSEFKFNQDFTTGSAETVQFTTVRYYLTNIKLEKMDGTIWAEEDSYHLIDAGDASSTLLSLENVPVGEYHKISYMIGVDSAHNVSGAQEGALSPSNNMFWSWNNGYIFFKIEGTSPQAASGNFAYHVGGFSGANNAITTKELMMHNHMLNISPDAKPQIHIKVDLKMAFDGMHAVSVATTEKVHMPGMMAVHLAHNFNMAFSLDHIHD